MAAANQPLSSTSPAPLVSAPSPTPGANGANVVDAHSHAHVDGVAASVATSNAAPLTNGHHHHGAMPHQPPAPSAATAAAAAGKKAKGKKTSDLNDFSKQVMGRITQLEVDSAAEKEQEAEIGTWTCDAGLSRGDTPKLSKWKKQCVVCHLDYLTMRCRCRDLCYLGHVHMGRLGHSNIALSMCPQPPCAVSLVSDASICSCNFHYSWFQVSI